MSEHLDTGYQNTREENASIKAKLDIAKQDLFERIIYFFHYKTYDKKA
jgi:hypothetical protein